jgi:type IV pilus assembly protein PilB
MIVIPSERLKEILVQERLIDGALFDQIAIEASRRQQRVTDILVSQNIINRDYLLLVLAKTLGVERVNLGAVKINEEILHLLPEDVSRRLKVVLFRRDEDGTIHVAMEDPTNLEALDFLRMRLGGKVRPYLVDDEDLNRGFALYESQLTKDFKKITEGSIQESLRSRAKNVTEAAAELPIVAIVGNLISYAVSLRASDIHIEVLEDVILIRYRVDGILHEIIRVPKEILPAVIARVKILSGLRVDEHTHPQDGRFRHKVGDQLIDVRVSVIPTFYGEKAEMRLLAAAQRPLSFAQLGMLDYTVKVLEAAISKTYGMVLACGPTGAGKTTTLYSVINILNRPEVNIITIEDPIEYELRYVNQMQVNPAAGITFASGLRSIVRQDPNIIMVGEIRDQETANISVQAALTGHLVMSSLHTVDAPTAVPRLVDISIPPFLVAAVLNVVAAQRLARSIHLDCIESYTPEVGVYQAIREQLISIGIDPASVKLPKTFYRGKGCVACGYTGYFGRIGVFEVLDITEKVRKLIISSDFNLDNLKRLAREEGMVTMFEDGLRKVERGLTTIEEIFRVIRE